MGRVRRTFGLNFRHSRFVLHYTLNLGLIIMGAYECTVDLRLGDIVGECLDL